MERARGYSGRIAALAVLDSLIVLAIVATGARSAEVPLVPEGAVWRYREGRTPPSDPPGAWRELGFDDAAWKSGPSGIGFGDAPWIATWIDSPQFDYVSLFLRTTFDVPDPSALPGIYLRVRYDDGFVAYLNGAEASRSPNMEAAGPDVPFDAVATSTRDPNETDRVPLDLRLLRPGRNLLAVEVHNVRLENGDLGIDPVLIASPCFDALGPVACESEPSEGTVTVSWSPGAFDAYRVTRNGIEIEGSPFDASTASAVDRAPGHSDLVYEVTPLVGADACGSRTCGVGCDDRFPDALSCAATLDGEATRVRLDWPARPGVSRVEVVRDAVRIAELPGDAIRHDDVPDVWSRSILSYDVILRFEDATSCRMRGHARLCALTLSCEVVDEPGRWGVQLEWERSARVWSRLTVRRAEPGKNEVIATLDPAETSYFDPSLPAAGRPFTYFVVPEPPPGEPAVQGCSIRCEVTTRRPPEAARYEPPPGGWDAIAEFGPGDDRYEPQAGEAGNVDGRWIRALDDAWDGSGPLEAGEAPRGPAPGGIGIDLPDEAGACGEPVSILRLLDPGDPGVPTGKLAEEFPDPFPGPTNNARLILGLDAGSADRNLLRDGVTFFARWRVHPSPPSWLGGGDQPGGSWEDAGLGQVGICHLDTRPERPQGAPAGLGFFLSPDDQLRITSDRLFLYDAADVERFVSVWATVADPEGDEAYDVTVYLDGSETPAEGFGTSPSAKLAQPEVGFGAAAGNYLYLALASEPLGGDIQVDAIAFKRGVHIPRASACPGRAAFRRGDADAGGGVEITDAIVILRHLFLGGAEPPCADAADADDSGELEITDAIRILGHLFLGDRPMAQPFEACGSDPRADDLECGSFPPCAR